MYTDKVLDHFANPRNVGELTDANGVAEIGNPTCGDITRIYLKIEDNIIKDIKFKTFGCAAAVASGSMLTEMAKGKTIEEALKITDEAVAEMLDGLPPQKMHCSNMAAEAMQAAIENYKEKLGA
ncbi:Fe-S cluster assembly scaffold protein NifU [Pelotomaculum propionicicum]|uniref:Iron-sulfur cluster assembly scaffold protein IscU n=1 Tax=Pelotomaculum propionicicum TaxID=258475 RepID=A0A4Y7RKF8_9FIRM|nr:Fe-S cluster assembly scaffold protein NifU [Pelotomaculum propionicicum]NLI12700.1 Fe-S cluster assembly scaffold protein NifU [Peptococcaceae bacterium]TEB09219.1 Iron-sulfur cluster assembly scaffold protein IscU [Pelotomaculum propionicicum]